MDDKPTANQENRSNNTGGNNKEPQKEKILLPYTLEVVEVLREVEDYVRGKYLDRKNSMDLKSLDPPQEIEIIIEIEQEEDGKEEKKDDGKKDNCFGKLLNKVRDHSNLEDIAKNVGNDDDLNTMIVILILARILGYDGEELWTDIRKFIENNKNGKKPIEQPFYKFKYYDLHKIGLVIRNDIMIPRDFVAAYFGYDTGIEGLNLLMYGGFLLPPDRSAYISLSVEAVIGKTALVVRLITAFFQNYNFKNVHSIPEEINKNDAQPLSMHYILMEQNEMNIIRLIKECQLIDKDNKNVKPILEDKGKITERDIRKIIKFEKSDMFYPMGLIEKVESI